MTTNMMVDAEAQVAEAREALADAERELEIADAAVETARERQGLGLAVRGLTIRAQVARARRQETLEVARSRLKALERIATAEREAATALAAREKAARSAVLRIEAKAIEGRIGQFLIDMIAEAEALDDQVADFNRSTNGSFLAPMRGLGAYASWDHVLGDLARLGGIFPAPKRTISTTPITKQEDPNV